MMSWIIPTLALVASAADPAFTLPPSCKPEQLLLADMNGDGRLDIVVGCDRELLVALNQGKSGFSSPLLRAESGGRASELVAADFDRDGKTDVAFADHDTFGVWLLRGDGKGGLSRMGLTRVQRTGSPHVHGLLSGDWNRDGKPDALHFNINENAAVALTGDGRGELSPAARISVGTPNNPVVGDFNGDGALDFASAAIQQGRVDVLLGDGKGGFAPGPGSPHKVAAARPYFVAAGDLNGDGKLDLAITHDDAEILTILHGDGKGGFRSPAPAGVRLPSGAFAVRIADANGDGTPDVVMSNGRQYQVLPNGDPTAKIASVPGPGSRGWTFVVGDLNGDGRPDFVSFASETAVVIHHGPLVPE